MGCVHIVFIRVITLVGNPRIPSRSAALLELAQHWLEARDIVISPWNLHDFVVEDLLYARFDSPALKRFGEQLAAADGLIVATPVYKASFSGALKTLLDLLPERALEHKVMLPLATGGTQAHMLAVDYALKPMLSALKAQEILHGVFADDNQITLDAQQTVLAPVVEAWFTESLQSFTRALGRNIHHGVRHYSVVT